MTVQLILTRRAEQPRSRFQAVSARLLFPSPFSSIQRPEKQKLRSFDIKSNLFDLIVKVFSLSLFVVSLELDLTLFEDLVLNCINKTENEKEP